MWDKEYSRDTQSPDLTDAPTRLPGSATGTHWTCDATSRSGGQQLDQTGPACRANSRTVAWQNGWDRAPPHRCRQAWQWDAQRHGQGDVRRHWPVWSLLWSPETTRWEGDGGVLYVSHRVKCIVKTRFIPVLTKPRRKRVKSAIRKGLIHLPYEPYGIQV